MTNTHKEEGCWVIWDFYGMLVGDYTTTSDNFYAQYSQNGLGHRQVGYTQVLFIRIMWREYF